MKPTFHYSTVLLSVCLALAAPADVLELKNGTVLNGRYSGGTANTVRFETGGGLQVIETSQIVALTFTSSAAAATLAAAAPAAAPVVSAPVTPTAPAAAPAPAAKAKSVTLPAGTMLLVRMIDAVSSQNPAGTPFTTKLEYDLGADGVVALKSGTTIYGKVQSSTQARRAVGRSTLDLRRSQIAVGGQPVPILTSGHKEAGQASIAKAAKGAGAGAAIGAIAGDAGKGAAIGATAGALMRGQTITVAAGALLEFTLTQPVTIPVAP